MKTRMQMFEVNPSGYKAMSGLEQHVRTSGIDKTLLELIKIRASQVNGCAYCINMHTQDARKLGESEQRIYALSAWRETPYFTPEERAVLALTESVTLVASERVSDEVYDEAARFFDQEALSHIIMAIVTINAWNRIAISTGMMPE